MNLQNDRMILVHFQGKPFDITVIQVCAPSTDAKEAASSDSMKTYNLAMEQQTGYKLGREYVKAVYWHPAYLTYIQQSASWETLGWMKHKLESRLQGEI